MAEMRNWHTLGWGYWQFNDPFVPQVDLAKFVVNSQFMTHGCERWSKNHTQFIQNAFFNGVGFESWENVWGVWNGMVPRDAELLRRAATIERFFGRQGYLTDSDWVPFAEEVQSEHVYGTRFHLGNSTLYLLINRYGVAANASVKLQTGKGSQVVDCYHGQQLSTTDSSLASVAVE